MKAPGSMRMREIRFGGRKIGPGRPCYIIAEAGSNHNGSLRQALQLIDVAVRAGADAVKFQTFRAARLYHPDAGKSDYLKLNQSIFEIIKSMEMPHEWIPRLAKYCKVRGIDFMSTPFDEDAVELLDAHVRVFKIASYEMTHHPLLRCVARKRKPVFLSTGAATLEEVRESVAVLRKEGCNQIVLLQCTASYPSPLSAANVSALVTLREATGCLTGLSDHTRDPIVAPMAAAALGAVVLEKHFTLSNDLPGPDHRFAVTPPELCRLVNAVRDVEQARGSGEKVVDRVEWELRNFARRSLFAARSIARGEVLSRENVIVLRNGKRARGLPPSQYERVLGKKASRAIPAGAPITRAVIQK